MADPISKFKFSIDQRYNGCRLDMALVAFFPDLSRRKIRRVIDLGGVYVNSHRIRIASRLLKNRDKIEFIYSENSLAPQSRDQKLALTDDQILYDEDGLFAISKPAGWPSVATQNQALFHAEKIVRDFLILQKRSVKEFQILHRLDRETSGVLLFGLENKLSIHLMEAFKNKKVKKKYLALAFGKNPQKEFSRLSFLSRIEKSTGMVRELREGRGGKESFTKFKIARQCGKSGLNLIEAHPLTGRSHQIRVHLASVGMPILGDRKYCNQIFFSDGALSEPSKALANQRHFLHASEVTLVLVDGKKICIKAPVPTDFEKVVEEVFS